MVRLSNVFVGIISFLFLAVGIAAVSFSVVIRFQSGTATACEKSIYLPLLITGCVLSLISLMGFIGACFRSNFILHLYLIVLFLLMLGTAAFIVFVLLVTSNTVSEAVSGLGFRQYRLGDYKNFLQNHLVNKKNWHGIRSCLIEARVCKSLKGAAIEDKTAEEFYKRKLTPIQSGCCIPPVACGFKFRNATSWEPPSSGTAEQNSDCRAWRSNEEHKLCFDCGACKAGVIVNIKQEWRILTIICSSLLVFIIVVYAAGCVAASNNRKHRMRINRRNASSSEVGTLIRV